jgi:tripartite-type tricarboxylate transporter receptor subunit TctC
MKHWTQIVGAFAALAIAGAAQAQNYPSREIKMIVPFPAGGPSDIVARIAADGMSKVLGHNVLIENVAGAGGTVGATRASEAAPDGYTLFAASMGTIIAAPTFYPNLKYDSTKDFEPIGMSANAPAAVSIKNDIPVKDLKEFVAWAKQKGSEVKQAHGGVGGTSHMACLLFNQVVGIKPTMVVYRGMGPGMNDLMGGHIDIACEQAVVMAAAIQGNKVKGIVVAGPQRLAAIPDVPTAREAGGGRLSAQHLERDLCAQGHAEGNRRQARRRARQDTGRSGDCGKARQARRHGAAEVRTRTGIPAQDGCVGYSALGTNSERGRRNDQGQLIN